MQAAAGRIRHWNAANVVVDLVMYAKNGCALMDPDSIDTLIADIVPLADLLTPNIPEAEKIAQMRIRSQEEVEAAARIIHSMGCAAVLIKGGHREGDATDVLFDGRDFHAYSGRCWRRTIPDARPPGYWKHGKPTKKY